MRWHSINLFAAQRSEGSENPNRCRNPKDAEHHQRTIASVTGYGVFFAALTLLAITVLGFYGPVLNADGAVDFHL